MGQKLNLTPIPKEVASQLTDGTFPKWEPAFGYQDKNGKPVVCTKDLGLVYHRRSEDERIVIDDSRSYDELKHRRKREQKHLKRDADGVMRVKEITQRDVRSPKVSSVKIRGRKKERVKRFFSNGLLKSDTIHPQPDASQKVGRSSSYFNNGAKRETSYYKVIDRGGKVSAADGIANEYHRSGNPISRTSVKLGKKKGWRTVYDNAGTLKAQKLFRAGKKDLIYYPKQTAVSYSDRMSIKSLVERNPDWTRDMFIAVIEKGGVSKHLIPALLDELMVKNA